MKLTHLKSPQQGSRTLRATALSALLGLAASTAQGEIIFQADFNGDGTGTGGASDIVTLGGTGSMSSSGTGEVTVESASPIGQGSYYQALNPESPDNKTSGTLGSTTFTPGAGASWADMQTSNGSSITGINGGFDFFFKPADIGSGGFHNNWFRPLDFGSNSTGNYRFILTSTGQDEIRIEFLSTGGFLTGAGYATTTSNLYTIGAPNWVEGETYHVGFTFDTDIDDIVTLNLFVAEGTGAIDTSSGDDLVASSSFKIASSITDGLSSGNWSFNPAGYLNEGSDGKIAQADTIRLYNDTPETFGAIPEPAAGALLLGLGALGLCFRRKSRK